MVAEDHEWIEVVVVVVVIEVASVVVVADHLVTFVHAVLHEEAVQAAVVLLVVAVFAVEAAVVAKSVQKIPKRGLFLLSVCNTLYVCATYSFKPFVNTKSSSTALFL